MDTDDLGAAFRRAVTAHGARPAVVAGPRTLTYAELGVLARETAQRLGPSPGTVGVLARHDPGTVVAMLGVWLAGGAYCPIDPAFPTDRRAALLAHCSFLLDPVSGLVDPVSGLVDPVSRLVDPVSRQITDLGRILAQDSTQIPDPVASEPVDREPVAYVLFTSGSTGTPKGVLTPQRAITAAVRSLTELFEITPEDRVLQFASLNWDTCFEEILPTLTSGAALVFHPDAHSGSFRRFLRLLETERITVIDLPTAYWHELVNHLTEEEAALPECVRLVVIGGEAASPARVADWSGPRTKHARLLNTYGCTETTLITHAVDLDGTDGVVPIGRALPHVVERVTEDGELVVGGPSVALGYLGVQSERFAGGFFHTGDRVSRRPDGVLVHEGRIDDEIKIRGVRVHPAEVEAYVAAHPAVAAVAVAGVRVADHTALVAYVVPRPGAATTTLAADVLAHLRGTVPNHLIPSRVQVVPSLAHTASGKVDRRRTKEAAAMPVDGVSQIFGRVLERPEVAADADFFALGGDSLLATRVLSAVAREYGVELTFEDFLLAPSPAALAGRIAGVAR
ncbi:nonribosomal peptide synthetase protein VioO [Hamadaea flava]|uniref:Non-ribosomal peptide synthetase n=1 Tax=Hamadaea flava TaxID=1742688 RepID=A0ABV8LPK3_9ACTN|nr:non-ribosomal peptide synthetase [Hamadaea flava]MCP2322708.1 nonribosomal peptide synthetase protein VioO [Hamadaea flava]